MNRSREEQASDEERRRARGLRIAAYGGALALLLLVGGVVVARSFGEFGRFLGLLCAGYGLGIGLAAGFLAIGRKPPRWRR